MDSSFNTSFIPKKSLQVNHGGREGDRFVRRREVYGPGFFLSSTFFAIALLVSIGLFGYMKIIQQRVDDKILALEKAHKGVSDNGLIYRFEQLDAHLRQANDVVTKHRAVSELLFLLEDITLKNVQYTELSFGANQKGAKIQQGTNENRQETSIPVSLVGRATSFETVALQLDQYTTSKVLHDARIDILEKDKDTGDANFSVSLAVDAPFVSFKQSLRRVNNTSTEIISPVTTTSITASSSESVDIPATTTPAEITP